MKSLLEQLSENPLQVALAENEELKEKLSIANKEIKSLRELNIDMGAEFSSLERHYKHLAEKERDSASVMRAQLAKASERIAELEFTVKGFKEFIAVARVMFLDLDEMEVNSKDYADLLSDLFTLFCGGDEFQKYVNKFAIENQIKAVEYCYKHIPDLPDSVYVKLKRRKEQLGKEHERYQKD